MRALLAGVGLVAVVAAAALTCHLATRSHDAPLGIVSFALEYDRFPKFPLVPATPFDLVMADMDLDGDADLLVNRHHLSRSELFENRNGRFVLLNPKGADPTGFYDNAGISDLFSLAEPLIAAVDTDRKPAVYVWHDPNRFGFWNVYVVTESPLALEVRSNSTILEVDLDPSLYEQRNEFELSVTVNETRHFRVKNDLVATRLEIRTAAPIYVGPAQHRVDGDSVVLWKDDPHGIAWVDAIGSPHPDLYVSRGGMKGELKPPHPPKTDRFLRYQPDDGAYAWAGSAIPPDYGRSRKVEWVDIDADGRSELYVGNTETKNVLLQRESDTRFRDIAAEKGLDFVRGAAFAWLDLNDDGFDELVLVDTQGFRVAWNDSGRFEVAPGAEIGLEFGTLPTAKDFHFDELSISVVDFDNDGHLDLWLSGVGQQFAQALFRFDGERFTDVTSQVGLAASTQVRSFVLFDFENDGYVDAVTLGEQPTVLHNRHGHGFSAQPLALGWQLPPTARGHATDVDSDGLTDLILVARVRGVARNTSQNTHRHLQVLFSEPRRSIGTVVRAHHANGMVRAQRYGSAHSTQYSQSVLPLEFGVPDGAEVTSLEVRWPGGQVETHEVERGVDSIELSRADGARTN